MRSAAAPRLTSPVHTPPRNLHQARTYIDSKAWREAYAKEMRTHQAFGSFRSVSHAQLLRGARVVRPVVRFTYKYHYDGRIKGHKAQLSLPSQTIKTGIHYDPKALYVFAADRDAVRLLMSVAAQRRVDLYHADHSRSSYMNGPTAPHCT